MKLVHDNKRMLNALQDAYGLLADIRHEWPGRNTPRGQRLLSEMRDAIALATGLTAQEVQDNPRFLFKDQS